LAAGILAKAPDELKITQSIQKLETPPSHARSTGRRGGTGRSWVSLRRGVRETLVEASTKGLLPKIFAVQKAMPLPKKGLAGILEC